MRDPSIWFLIYLGRPLMLSLISMILSFGDVETLEDEK